MVVRVGATLPEAGGPGTSRRALLLAAACVSILPAPGFRRLAFAQSPESLPTAPAPGFARASDEFDVSFEPGAPLGLTLKDLSVGTTPGQPGSNRVVVADIIPGKQAEAARNIQIDQLLVAVNGVNVERERAEQVSKRLVGLLGLAEPFTLTFKDPYSFLYALQDPFKGSELSASTALTPSTENAASQVLGVRRFQEEDARCRRTAADGDLLEIAYTGRVKETGKVFDGMQLASRLGDSSVQFVLGRQPGGQFPPAWDVGLPGMCIGERRILEVPPILGYGAKGLPKVGVPPNAYLQYEVELLAINADSTP